MSKKRKRGRPKGSKNKNSKATVELEKLFLLVFTFLQIIKSHLKLPNLRYFIYNGAEARRGMQPFCTLESIIEARSND